MPESTSGRLCIYLELCELRCAQYPPPKMVGINALTSLQELTGLRYVGKVWSINCDYTISDWGLFFYYFHIKQIEVH